MELHTHGAEIPEPRALRHHLAERLPDYMIPTAWSILDAFPLTRTGKLDRRALPDPEPVETDAASAPPETPAETTLADIWAELLGREAIGRHDHFFELGGHSLLATRMLARVREIFGVDAPLRLVFEAPTLAEMAAALVDAEGDSEGGAERAATIVPVDRGAPLPVSFAQRRLWFLDQLEPDSAAYVLSAGIRMLGRLDREAFSAALDALVARHETLRTRLVDDAGEPIQVVDPPRSRALPLIDLSDRAHDAALTEARRRAAEETRQPMDLAAGPLLRTTLLRLRDDDHVFLLSIHHIVSDGWSTGIFFRDLSTFYDAALRGRDAGLVELPVQYADFAAWEQDHLSGARLDRQLDFWREQLDGAPASLELPTDRPRPAQQTFVGTRHRIHLSAELSKAITACSQALGATPFMTLLAAWSLLLGRHAGQDDVVVGTPVAHRDRTELEGLIGLFANTLPLRTRLAGVGTFAELVDRVRRGALDALAHQDLPFEKLVIELEVERNLSHSPIFQVMFSMQNLEGVDARFGDLQLTGLSTDYGRSQFDINLVLSEGRETADAEPTFGGWIEYNTDLFDASTMAAYARRFVHVLEQLTTDPHRRLDQVDLLGADERATILQAWNDTTRELPAITLH
ncbi:MAG: condensation domain-containing protein, partial [Acidobacteriota bacterium]